MADASVPAKSLARERRVRSDSPTRAGPVRRDPNVEGGIVPSPADRAQVGIGTLILFVAVILVASLAAGVLITTSGLLQAQAEITGDESASQVTDNLEVINAAGIVNESDGTRVVNETRLGVQKAPSAGHVDLEALSIQYVGPGTSAMLVYEDRYEGGRNRGGYALEPVRTVEDDNVLMDTTDRYEIVIPLDGQDIGEQIQPIEGGLEPASEVQLTITTATGAQRAVTIRTPDSLADNGDGASVPL